MTLIIILQNYTSKFAIKFRHFHTQVRIFTLCPTPDWNTLLSAQIFISKDNIFYMKFISRDTVHTDINIKWFITSPTLNRVLVPDCQCNMELRVRKSYGSCCLEAVEECLRNAADRTEGGAVRKWLHEVFAFLYAGAKQRIQRHRT